MKWVFILLNIVAAIAVIVAGSIVCSIHDVHSYSTFVELKDKGALAPSSTHPSSGSLNVEERLKAIGGLSSNLPPVTYVAAGIFLLNALAFFFGWQKGSAQPKTES